VQFHPLILDPGLPAHRAEVILKGSAHVFHSGFCLSSVLFHAEPDVRVAIE
jgi:hypothetical protein